MNYDLVVFDIAGTTVSDRGNINESFRDSFKNVGIDVAPSDIDKVMGYRKVDAVKIIADKYAPSDAEDVSLIDTIHEDFIQRMVSFYENDYELKPLPYAEEIFSWLRTKGVRVALNTGFTRGITDTILNRLGWQSSALIDAIICSDEVPEGRPYPYMIYTLMKYLGINDNNRVVKVGDTEVDVQEGRNAQCGLVISTTTGSYTREQLKEYAPDYIIDSLNELPDIIGS